MSDADRKSETPEENPINREVPEQTTAMAHGAGEPHAYEEGGASRSTKQPAITLKNTG